MHDITARDAMRIFVRRDGKRILLVRPDILIGICGDCMGSIGSIPLANPTLAGKWTPEPEECTCAKESQ